MSVTKYHCVTNLGNLIEGFVPNDLVLFYSVVYYLLIENIDKIFCNKYNVLYYYIIVDRYNKMAVDICCCWFY